MKDKVYNTLNRMRDNADKVADILNSDVVTTEVILGAIGEENESLHLKDYVQDDIVKLFPNFYINYKYEVSKDSHNRDPSNPMKNDIGPGNINIRTAMLEVDNYAKMFPNSDPLDLKQYLGNPSTLISDLTNENKMTTAAISGLHLLRAEKVAATSDSWIHKSKEEKGVIVITMYNNGIYRTEKNIANMHGNYDLKPLDHLNVDNLVNAMAVFSPPAMGQMILPDDYQQALTPVIAVNWQ